MGGTGIAAGIKGFGDNAKAKNLIQNAEERRDVAAGRLELQREACSAALQSLGREKMVVLDDDMQRFVASFKQLKNVDFRDSLGIDEVRRLKVDEASFSELEQLSDMAAQMLQGGIAGVGAGALTAMSAYGAAGLLATASTGTAISSLSGAAAANATLAFFGGGALAGGGLGMAGGAVVLGGLVAGPALLAFGMVLGLNGGKNLENAKAHSAETDKYVAQWEAAYDLCVAIRDRAYLFYALLADLDAKFAPAIEELDRLICERGDDYAQYDAQERQSVAAAASLAASIKAVLDTPLLKEDGSLTEESGKLLEHMREVES
ncbi:hypothetical protein BMAGN_0802 [Bifidobacterium magnum]|uniref:Uncharacterized protein n=2 Tax=Bifidobacterium magnum TaxID=1692 RepID=A0A087B9A1_9BIFI|nr:hypothetical protein BMAGN_0802 [Bifidobacterium magnum]